LFSLQLGEVALLVISITSRSKAGCEETLSSHAGHQVGASVILTVCRMGTSQHNPASVGLEISLRRLEPSRSEPASPRSFT